MDKPVRNYVDPLPYVVVHTSDPRDLESMVAENMQRGYVLQGGVCAVRMETGDGWYMKYYQAMYRPSEKSNG